MKLIIDYDELEIKSQDFHKNYDIGLFTTKKGYMYMVQMAYVAGYNKSFNIVEELQKHINRLHNSMSSKGIISHNVSVNKKVRFEEWQEIIKKIEAELFED